MAQSSEENNSKEASTGLDLGLSALHEGVVHEESVPENPIEAPLSLEAAAPSSKYESFLSHQDWSGLSKFAERKLESNGDDAEARLWWIRAQARLREVPLGMLQAPLEAVCSGSLSTTSEERALTLTTLHEIGHAMIEEGDPRGAVPLLLRAFEAENIITPDLVTSLRHEIDFLDTVKDYANEETNKKKVETYRKILSDKATLEGASPHQVAEVSNFEPKYLPPLPHGGIKSGSSTSALVIGILVLLCGAFAVSTLLSRESDSPEISGPENLPRVVARATVPQTILPVGERATKFNELDALYHEIETADADRKKEQPAPFPPDAARKITNEYREEKASPSKKEVIDTEGPVEERGHSRDRDDSRRDNDSRDDRIYDDMGRGSKDDGGLFPNRRGGGNIFSDRSQEYGLGVPRSQKSTTPSRGMDVDEGAPPPLPVDKFDVPREFRVIARTGVMERPSFRGSPKTNLERGDKVLATSRIGDWLKIRSKRGELGYIFVQDTSEVK